MPIKFWKYSLLGFPGLLLALSSAQLQAQSRLSFEQALQASQAQSLDYQRSQLAAALSEADLKVLDYENDFKLSLGAGISDYRPRAVDSGSSTASSKDRGATLTLSKTLYDFGRHSAKMSQADLLAAIRNLSVEELKDNIRNRTARAYGLVVSAQIAAAITTNQVLISEKRLAEQTKNYRAGLRSESDFIGAQVDLGKARLTKKKSEDDLHLARLALAAIMGDQSTRALTDEVVFATDLPGYTTKMEALVNGWSAFQVTALQLRREKEGEVLSLERDLVSVNKRPVLAGSIAAQKTGPWGGELKDLYTAQVSFSWDIPWNGMGREESSRVALKAKDLELQRQLDEKSRRDKAEAARQNFGAAIGQLRASFDQEKLTGRLVSLVRQRYQSGKATTFEVSAAETDSLNAQLEQSRLLTALINAVIDLAEARGIADISTVFPGGV